MHYKNVSDYNSSHSIFYNHSLTLSTMSADHAERSHSYKLKVHADICSRLLCVLLVYLSIIS